MATRKSFTPKTRNQLLKDAQTGQNIQCSHCGKNAAMHIHHIKPVCEGGSDDPSNLLMLCQDCHIAHHQSHGDFKSWGKLGGSKTAQSMKSFRNLPQFRGEAGMIRFQQYIERKMKAEMGIMQ